MRFAIQLLQSYWIMNNMSLPQLLLWSSRLHLICIVMQRVLMNISDRAPAAHSPHCRPSTRAPFGTFLPLLPASERREKREENSVFICLIFLHKFLSPRLDYCQHHDNSFCPNCDGLKPYFLNLGVAD